MNNHMNAAIQAGDDAYGKAFVIIGTIGDMRHHAMATALEAALPHLRAMIAQEILDHTYRNMGGPGEDYLYQAAMQDAAQIAKGPHLDQN